LWLSVTCKYSYYSKYLLSLPDDVHRLEKQDADKKQTTKKMPSLLSLPRSSARNYSKMNKTIEDYSDLNEVSTDII